MHIESWGKIPMVHLVEHQRRLDPTKKKVVEIVKYMKSNIVLRLVLYKFV